MKYEELKKGDFISLGKAVAKFNKTIRELRNEENKTYMPAELNYKDVKDLHVTKSELDQYIKDLRNFGNDNIEKVKYNDDEYLTKWEHDMIRKEKTIALRRLNRKLKEEKYNADERKVLQNTITNLKSLKKLTGSDFEDTIRRIHRIGTKDYDMRRAIQYRENYYKALEELSNFKNYDKFKEKLDSITNPLSFFRFIQKSDVLSELFTYYKRGAGLVISPYATTEDAFNDALQSDYKIKIDEDINYAKNTRKKKYKYRLQTKSGKIIAQSDSRQYLISIINNSKDKDIKNSNIWLNEEE